MSPIKRNPPRRISGQERKASLIAAAASLFAKKGFAGTTTREIARSVGVSETLVFKHFPTKRTLYAAILAEKSPLPHLLPILEEAAQKRDDRRVFTVIAGTIIRRDADPDLPRLLLFSALEGHKLSEMFFQNHVRGFYDFLSGYIRRRVRDGAFRDDVDPLLAARAFMGMVVYHRLLSFIFKVPVPHAPEVIVETYVRMFLASLRPS
jgi:TetR/AcrR family transcriptional regulator